MNIILSMLITVIVWQLILIIDSFIAIIFAAYHKLEYNGNVQARGIVLSILLGLYYYISHLNL